MTQDLQIQIIGFVAGFLIIISFIPQLITIPNDILCAVLFWIMYTISAVSQCLWCIYGSIKLDMQILITNIGTLTITILIIGFSLYYKHTKDKYIENI